MATVDQTMMKVQRLLTGPMGLRIEVQNDAVRVSFQDTSTVVQIKVFDWGKNSDDEPRTVVTLSAPILFGVRATPQLFEWIARNGGSRWIGHVELFDDDEPGTVSLFFSHALVGDFLDEEELAGALWSVLGTADDWDDELQSQFGGKRFADL